MGDNRVGPHSKGPYTRRKPLKCECGDCKTCRARVSARIARRRIMGWTWKQIREAEDKRHQR